jgi:4-alpha-glucanotransferase
MTLTALRSLAKAMGVHTRYTDGLGKRVAVGPETLVRVCAALGAPIASPSDAAAALQAHRAARNTRFLPPVLVAWEGALPHLAISGRGPKHAELHLADGAVVPLESVGAEFRATRPLPFGYHRLTVEGDGRREACTIIAAPARAWRRPGSHRSWGVSTQLAALRSARSRSVGDLRDLQSLCRWVHDRGGDLVTVLPLLPTFNSEPPEPSPYSPVSRLFWSELILDLKDAHRPSALPTTLDVTRADAEVRAALAGHPAPHPSSLDEELVRYARYRGAQARLGRNWRVWPTKARAGTLAPDHVDAEVERFHLVAQTLVRRQLHDLRQHLEHDGIRLGLDLAVGVHPDGYDPWSRQTLFADGMSVGAPPDKGFPSGQDWGFAPVLPEVSRREGHRYLAASIALQAGLAGVLRVDHIMAWTRLYWIPHGFGMHEGTYVSYPAEELFAVLCLESDRNRCEVVGENLGTVPPEIDAALPRHRIWGMYLAQFEVLRVDDVAAPTADDVAMVGTHDTPTFAGWLAGNDIADRIRYGLLATEAAAGAAKARSLAVRRLARRLGHRGVEPRAFLADLLEWLGRSASPLVVAWLEDLWLEDRAVNLPGTSSSVRPNWQRPMSRLLDDIMTDPVVDAYLTRLDEVRTATPVTRATPRT